jgi:hypothetical protein
VSEIFAAIYMTGKWPIMLLMIMMMMMIIIIIIIIIIIGRI